LILLLFVQGQALTSQPINERDSLAS